MSRPTVRGVAFGTQKWAMVDDTRAMERGTFSDIRQKGLWFSRSAYLVNLALLGAYYPKFGRYALYDWVGLIAVLAGFGYYIIRGRFPPLNRSLWLFTGLLFLGAIVTIPNDLHPSNSVFSVILMFYTLVIWLSLPSFSFIEWKHLRWAFMALGISVSVTTMYAIGQKLIGLPFLGEGQFWGRATGLTRHPNELGVFCAMVFPYLMVLVTTSTRLRGKAIWTVAALLAVIGVLLSGSMTGAIALLAGILGYYFTTSRRGRIRTVMLILIGTIAISGFTAMYSRKHATLVVQRIERFLSTHQGKLTLEQRLVGDRNAWKYIESNPFQGHGYHSRVQTIAGTIEIHNTILRSWYDGGIFTLLAVLALLFGAAFSLVKARKRIVYVGDILHKPYVAGAIGSYIAFLVMIQASPVLYQRSAWFSVAIAFAIVSMTARSNWKEDTF